MHRITLIFLLALLLPDLYIYVRHIRQSRSHLLRGLYWLPTLLLLATYFYYFFLTGENAMSHHVTGIGRMGIGILLLCVPKLVFALCSLAGMAVHAVVRRCPSRPFTAMGTILAIIFFACTLYATLIGITRFEVKEVEFRSEHLPQAFDGYRILQLSDIHIGSWQGREKSIRRLVQMANDQKADLIVFTGDLVNQQSHELDDFREILSQLHAPDGVYSILGNHDYGDYYHWPSADAKAANLQYLIEQQRKMGWKMLNNSHDILHHRGDSIALIGVENDGEPPFSQYADLPKATRGTEGMFSILLSHNPTHWRREVLPTSNIDLMLAGHTHAMQCIVFGHSFSELKYPEWKGMYNEGGQYLYVNIGIGYVGLPFRLGAWPELTVLTLRRK